MSYSDLNKEKIEYGKKIALNAIAASIHGGVYGAKLYNDSRALSEKYGEDSYTLANKVNGGFKTLPADSAILNRSMKRVYGY